MIWYACRVKKKTFHRIAKYPLIKYTDMTQAMREEAVDISVTAVEKYPKDYEKVRQLDAMHVPRFLDV